MTPSENNCHILSKPPSRLFSYLKNKPLKLDDSCSFTWVWNEGRFFPERKNVWFPNVACLREISNDCMMCLCMNTGNVHLWKKQMKPSASSGSDSWESSYLPWKLFDGITIYEIFQIINTDYKMGGILVNFIYHRQPNSQNPAHFTSTFY